MLLVFGQTCEFCEKNWPAWDKMFAGSSNTIPVYFVTTDSTVGDAYVRRHPLMKRGHVLTGVDTAALQAFNISSVPQSIWIKDGKVEKSWIGVLSNKDAMALATVARGTDAHSN